MNIRLILTLLLLGGLAPSALFGQSDLNAPRPTSPLVAPVPENAAWVVTIGNVKPPASKPDSPSTNASTGSAQPDSRDQSVTEIHATKTGGLKRDVISYANGSSMEIWYVNGVLFCPDSDKDIMEVDYHAMESRFGNGLGSSTESAGFTGLDWLNLKYYDQVVLYHGVACYHYAITIPSPQSESSPTPLPPMSAEAWIEVKSGLPMAYTAGDGKLYTYRFLDPPTTPLTLPSTYQSALTAFKKDQDKKERLEKAAAAFSRP